jgi:hypothetical protein
MVVRLGHYDAISSSLRHVVAMRVHGLPSYGTLTERYDIIQAAAASHEG